MKKSNKDRVYAPVKVLKEWSMLTVPGIRFFSRALFSVLLFTVLFAGYFALCEYGSLNIVQWLLTL